jgi:hypothetical protein
MRSLLARKRKRFDRLMAEGSDAALLEGLRAEIATLETHIAHATTRQPE